MSLEYVDLPFVLAVAGLGWGLSLMSYRFFALRHGWPMGEWHINRPALPILIGLICVVLAALFALARGSTGYAYGGIAVPITGAIAALLWTAMLRVASQVSLVLAPAATALMTVAWLIGPQALEYSTVRSEIRELREQLRDQGMLRANPDQPRLRDSDPGARR